MKPTRGNNSPLCHSFALACFVAWGISHSRRCRSRRRHRPVKASDLPVEGLDVTLIEEGTGRVVGRFHWTAQQLAAVLNDRTPNPLEP